MAVELVHRWMGFGVARPQSPTLATRLMAYVDIGRPLVSVMCPFSVAGPAVLANRGFPPAATCAIGVFAVLLVGWGIHSINDFVHHEQDKLIWPGRPIPSGRVTRREALAISLACYAGALAISWFFFSGDSKANFVLLLIGCSAGWLYATYTRDRVGYLSLPPLVGLFDLGGWAAFSPGTLFSDGTPWLLFLLAVTWQGAHIMVLSAAFKGGASPNDRVRVPAFFFTPTAKGACALAVGFMLLFWPLTIALFVFTDMGLLFLAPALAAGAYATMSVFRFAQAPADRGRGAQAFNRLTLLRIIYPGAMLLHYAVF